MATIALADKRKWVFGCSIVRFGFMHCGCRIAGSAIIKAVHANERSKVMKIASNVQTFSYQPGTAGKGGRQSFVRVPMNNVKDCPRIVTDDDGHEHTITRVVGWGAVADKISELWKGTAKSATRMIEVVWARPRRRTDRNGNLLDGSDLVILELPSGEKDKFFAQASEDSSFVPDIDEAGEPIPF